MAKLLSGTRIYGTATVDTQLFVSGSNAASSTITGALRIVGGIGVGGAGHFGGNVTAPTFVGNLTGVATTASFALLATTTTNLASGTVGSLPYQSAAGTTAMLSLGIDGYVLTAGATAPQWTAISSLSAGLATTSTNIANGLAGQLVFQSSPGITSFVTTAATGFILSSNGSSAPSYVSQASLSVGTATSSTKWTTARTVTFTGDTTGTFTIDGSTNVTGVNLTIQPNSVELGTDTTGNYVATGATSGFGLSGSTTGENQTFTVTSNGTSTNTASTLVFRDASGNFNAGTITANLTGIATTATLALLANTATLALSANTSTNIAGGSAGSVVYQSSTSTTAMLALGTTGFVLTAGATAPQWTAISGLSAGLATTATNIAGGTAGQVPYQSSTGTTSFYGPGTAGNVLVSNGTNAPTYQNTLTLTGTTAVNSTNTGALQVRGGVGIAGGLFVGGRFTTTDVVAFATNASGSVASFGIANNRVWIQGGSANNTIYSENSQIQIAPSAVNWATQGALFTATSLTVNYTGSAVSTNTGALQVRGGVGIGGDLYVGGEIVAQKLTIQFTTVTTTLIQTDDVISTYNATASISTNTGALQIVGGAGIGGRINAGGLISGAAGASITGSVTATTFFGALTGNVTGTATNATNVIGGAAGSLVYQSAANTTAMLALGTSGFVLTAGASAPQWTAISGLSAGLATTATNIVITNDTSTITPQYITFVSTTTSAGGTGLKAGSANSLNYIPSSGFHGIGIDTPTSPLHIVSSVNSILRFRGGTTGTIGILYSDANIASLTNNSTSESYAILSGTNALSMSTNATTRLTIDLNGQVKVITSTAATSTSTGALVVNGGVGIGDRLYVGRLISGAAGASITGSVTATTFFGALTGVATTATNLAGGAAGSVGYQSAAGITAMLALGTNGQVLTAGATAPQWTSISGLTAGLATTATNVAGGSAGSIVYQSGVGTTAMLAISTAGYFLTVNAGATAPQWTQTLGVTNGGTGVTTLTGVAFGNGTSAFTAATGAQISTALGSTNISGNAANVTGIVATNNGGTGLSSWTAGDIAYYSSGTALTKLALGTAGFVLTAGASAPQWTSVGNITAGIATTATQIRTTAQANNANYFPTFVDSNNASAAGELVYTTSSFSINPSTNVISFNGVALAGTVNSQSTVARFNVVTGNTDSLEISNVRGTAGADWTTAGFRIQQKVDSTWMGYIQFNGNTAGTNNGGMSFGAGTTTVSANSVTERLRITSSGDVIVLNTTAVNSAITGALQVRGGLGVSGNVFVSGTVTATNFVGAFSGAVTGTASQVQTTRQATNATYFPTFVDANNASAASETVFTTSSFSVNPSTGNVSLSNVDTSIRVSITNDSSSINRFPALVVTNYNGGVGGLPVIELQSSNGSVGTPSSVTIGGILGGFNTWGHNGTSFQSATRIQGVAENTFSTSVSAGLQFFTTNAGTQAERVRIDSFGNLGLGVTPGTWNSTFKVIQMSNTAAVFGRGAGGVGLYDNARYQAGASYRYITTATASGYLQSGGDHVFFSAPSGAATDAISFAQAMTLKASGNLGIGTASPTHRLTVTTSTNSATTTASSIALHLFNLGSDGITTTSPNQTGIGFGQSSTRSAIVAGTFGNDYIDFFNNGDIVTPKVRMRASGAIAFGGINNIGSSGQILQSNGDASPTWVSPSGLTAGIATQIQTTRQATNATYFPAFVDSNNASATGETVFTTSSFVINPSTGNVGLGITPTVKFEVTATTNIISRMNGSSGGTGLEISNYANNLFVGDTNVNNSIKFSTPDNSISFLTNTGITRLTITGSSIIQSGTVGGGGNNLVLRGGTGAASEGAHIVMGYGNNTSSALIGQGNNSWNIDVADGVANNNFRIFRQNNAGATAVAVNILESNAGVQVLSLGIGTAASGTTGEIRATNEITAYYSDRRLKENVKPIDNAVEKVLSLNGITYTPNDLARSFGYISDKTIVGLFADEVDAVLPEAVRPAPFDQDEDGNSKSGENYQTIQYEKIVPLLVEAIKEQQKQIAQLSEMVNKLVNK
jgi:hypothetical protein